MENSTISRRKFLAITSLTSLAILPCLTSIAKVTGIASIVKFIDYACRLTDHESLLNIEFYFIGVNRVNDRLFGCTGRQSFVVVRLPQQHVAESYIILNSGDVLDCSTSLLAQTRIAGYSYLVFQLFFESNNGRILNNGFLIGADNLLNWNAPWIKLIVREDQAMSQQLFNIEQHNPNPGYPGNLHPSPIRFNEYPIGYKRTATGNLVFSPEYYPKSADDINNISIYNPAPVTAIEAPYRLVLSPELPNHDYVFRWTYSQKPDSSYRKLNGAELWMATLQVILDPDRPLQRKKKVTKGKNKKDANYKPASEPSENEQTVDLQPMAIDVIGSPDYRPDSDQPQCDPDPGFRSLPNSADRRNLVELYFLSKTILRSKSRKLIFTPLGICGTIEFQNTLYKEIMDRRPRLDLYQWKQSISFGRDQEVQVVNLVKEMCFSQMMLHVRTTKRRTQCAVSFLDYTEYLIPLEHDKNYLIYSSDDNNKYVRDSYKFNTPFKSVRFATLTAKQIQPVETLNSADCVRISANSPVLGDPTIPCVLNNSVIAFWAKQPYPVASSDEHRYLEWDFIATDWQDKTTIITKKLYLVSSVFNCSTSPDFNLQLPDLSALTNLSSEILKPAYSTEPTGIYADLYNIEKQIDIATKSAIKDGKKVSQEWTQVYRQSEQFLMEKSDLFRQHLQNIFSRIDFGIQDIYKKNPKWIDGQGDVEEIILKFKSDFYKTIQDNLQDINRRLNNFKSEALNLLRSPVTEDLHELADWVMHYGSIPGEYLKEKMNVATLAGLIPATFKTAYSDLQTKIDSLDRDIDIFIQSLPPGLRLPKLKGYFQEAKQVYCFLEHVESSCKSRVLAYKNVIGISLYKVEQGIEDLKQELQTRLGKDWQSVYKPIEDYYHKANRDISNITTEAIIFKNNVRAAVDKTGQKAMDFFNYDATRLQLHSLQGYVNKVNDTVNKEVLVRLSMAQDYLRSQVDNEIFDIKSNANKTFAKIHTEAKEYIKGAMREVGHELGGIVNPQIASDLLSYYHDARSVVEQVNDTVTKGLDEIKASSEQLQNTFQAELDSLKKDMDSRMKDMQGIANAKKAEVLAVIDQRKQNFQEQFNIQKAKVVLIADKASSVVNDTKNQAKEMGNQAIDFFKGLEAKILGSIKLKDILDLDNTKLPKLNKTNKSLYYNFITNNFKSIDIGTISFNSSDKTRLVCYFEKPLMQPNAYLSQTRLENFSLGIFGGRIIVDFTKLEIISTQETKNRTNVEIGNVSFHQELAFLDALSKNIKIPGTGILLNITPQGVLASYTYSFPSISGGAFTMANLKFNVGINIPFPVGGGNLKPVTASFGINTAKDPFVVAVSIFGGRGHFVLETTPRYINKIDFGLEFGGYLGLNLGIAQGEAYLMAGMRYVFTRNPEGESSMSFYGYLTCGGSLTVFGFITISITFILCLAYEQTPSGSSLTGTASLTLSVKIGFFEKSFSLTFTKRIAGSDNNSGAVALNEVSGGLIDYAKYDEDTNLNSPFAAKEHRLFTDAGWNQYCKSFSY